MTTTLYADMPSESDRPASSSVAGTGEASRRWRSVWRLHFYSGMFAMPFILLMAVTGLVILYTQPIQDLTQGDLRTVSAGADVVSFDDQAAAVADAFPDTSVVSLTPPAEADRSTAFGLDDGRLAFVDPYTAVVLGSTDPTGGIVGLANRVHGSLNNESASGRALPTVAAAWDGGSIMRDYVVGDLVLEIAGVWTLVLVLSGLYLWWPRRSTASTGMPNRRRRFAPRRGVSGRARRRDLHGVGGVFLFGLVMLTVVSGMAWSTYWGSNFSSLADEITPSTWTDAPASGLGERGDLDRLGNQINWNTGDRPIPASYATATDGTAPAAISLDAIALIGETEGMKPGYSIYFPENGVDEAGNALYGSFTLSNSWPRKTGEARDLSIDQFSGDTLAEQSVYGFGAVSRGMDTLVSTHMGTQFGIVTRLLMTALCLVAIWSVISALVMFTKRRRPGSTGLPRRPVDVHLSRNLAIGAVVVGLVYPLWGMTALIILGIDRFVIRRTGPLRRTFGQP